MPQIEVRFADGRRSEFPLNRKSPLTIGAQAFNDIAISDDGVSTLHCRIGWNKTGYEVTAATPKGVDLNGTIVEHAFLKPGDVLRVGSCDLVYRADAEAKSKKADPAKPAEPVSKPPAKPAPPPAPESSIFEGEILVDNDSAQAIDESLEDLPTLKRSNKEKEKPAVPAQGVMGQVGRELQGGRRRPGEQEIFKSPLILGLGGGGIVLLLVAGTIWFLMGRETSAQLFAQAERELGEARYAQAIELFEQYATRYPGSTRTKAAKLQAAQARVQKELAGATPAWSLAMERLQGLVREYRNSTEYASLKPIVRSYAEQVAYGAAGSAEQTRDAALLPISAEALQLMERSADPETPQGPIIAKIQEATLKAEAAITRQQTRDAAVATMQTHLQQSHPIEALAEREKLLRKFPQYQTDRGVDEVLQAALKMAQSAVTVEDIEQPAQADHAATVPWHLWPVSHSRSRTDEASLGQTVWLMAGGCCYGIDTVTGEPRWRVVLGEASPFDPVEVRGDPLAWILYDNRRQELMSCRADTGVVLWRQSLTARPQGAPLVDQGQIYVALEDGHLVRIDAETGELTARLTFSQPVQGPPTLDVTGDMLYLVGERGVIYSLRKRPLECVAVTFADHAAGSVRAPIVSMGQLLLLCENDRSASARLRLWSATEPTRPLKPVSEQRVAGLVFDAPALRGAQLVVPLNGERIAAFVVNDEPGRMSMTLVGEYRVQDGYDGPMYVILGPDQMFWLSSTALRRFHIASDALQLSPTMAAVGLTAQHLQAVGEMFFVGRRLPYTSAVQLTNIDRDRMTGTWKTVAGAKPLAVMSGNSGTTVVVTDSGLVFPLNTSRRNGGGMERSASVDLDWPPQLSAQPIASTLSDGRVAISIAAQPSRLWLVEPQGRAGSPIELAQPLECAPVLLSAGLVLPQAGRLTIRPQSPSQRFEDWRAPAAADQEPTRWVHLARTGDDELLGIDSQGHCRRFQLRMGEIPHLAEVSSIDLTPLSVVTPLLMNESLVFVNIEHELIQLDHRTLAPSARRAFANPILGIAVVENDVLAWDADALRLLDPANDFADRWSIPLKSLRPVGRVMIKDDDLWIACQSGEVLVLNRQTGEERGRHVVPQNLTWGIWSQGSEIWAIATDSTLYRLEPAMEAQP
ncbi:PQQ-binding-like beta-propeller repeat protein [bacterium]|nr:PQQ-binding-like beta-propeller repeat protein [bacterium]